MVEYTHPFPLIFSYFSRISRFYHCSIETAFEFDEAKGGLTADEDYPYTGLYDSCKENECTPVSRSIVTSYVDIPEGFVHRLLMSIIKSPTSIAIQAVQLSLWLYVDGVCDDIQHFEENMVDRGVLAVGFSYDEDADMNYIRVKNEGDKG